MQKLLNINFSKDFWLKILFLQIFVLLMIFFQYQKLPTGQVDIDFFNVKLGDAILIKSPHNHLIMIDGGTDDYALEKIMQKQNFFNRNLDALILTHTDADHIIGAYYALDNFQIKNLILSEAIKNTDLFTDFLNKAQKKNVNIVYLNTKNSFEVDGLLFSTLWPSPNPDEKLLNNTNNTSLVLMLDIFNKKILLTGDIEKKIETEILKNNFALNANLIKIAHHGSSTSSGADFIKAVNPKFAIIQATEDNPYKHPHYQTLKTLIDLNIQYWQTGLVGDIQYQINPNFSDNFIFSK